MIPGCLELSKKLHNTPQRRDYDESIHSDGDSTEDNNFDTIRGVKNDIDAAPKDEDTDVSDDDADDGNESGDELTITQTDIP